MINGVHIKGEGLPGAVVTLQDSSFYLVREKNGLFSFPIKTEDFSIISVELNGYKLIDDDFINRVFFFSRNPLYIVMDTPEKITQDLLDSERSLRRTLQTQLAKLEKKYDALLDEHKITLSQYQDSLQKLYSTQKINEQLISRCVKEFALIDYDQISDLNQKIQYAFSIGNLTEVDSLIHTRGDINERIANFEFKKKIQEERREDINEELRELERFEAGTQEEFDLLSDDLWLLYRRYLLAFDVTAANYCVDRIVRLDSTNITNVGRAAGHYWDVGDYNKAKELYTLGIEICDNNPDKYLYESAALRFNLGSLFGMTHCMPEGETLINESLRIVRNHGGTLYSDDKQNFLDKSHIDLALAGIYQSNRVYDKAELIYKNFIDSLRTLQRPNETESSIADLLFMLSATYHSGGKLSERDKVAEESIDIFSSLAQRDSIHFLSLGANLMMYVTCLLESPNEYADKAENLLHKAEYSFKNYEKYSKESQEWNLTQVKSLLAYLYSQTGRLNESELLYKEALLVCKKYAEAFPLKYNKQLCQNLVSYASVLSRLSKYDESVSHYIQALATNAIPVISFPEGDTANLAHICRAISQIMTMQGRYEDAIPYMEKEELYIQESQTLEKVQKHENLIRIYDSLRVLYGKLGNYSKVREYKIKAINAMLRHAESD